MTREPAENRVSSLHSVKEIVSIRLTAINTKIKIQT